ncbi:MAG: nicotinate-nucleotide--dimethylbenzimidazole phosphoribosyltransferase [Alphaproteobacteria bacterium]|nr:nicotinate-nucleotide--dimethylbenzimidazole phosphoribosyltransferase [Alphaproteobacteria bacterium]
MAESEVAASFDEMRELLAAMPGPDEAAQEKAAAREAELTKPAGALGRLESLTAWFASWQGRYPPQLEHPRVAVFAANHGVAAQGVSAYPTSVTAQMVGNFQAGGAAINQLCLLHDADLRVYEMALEHPTTDFTQAPAMSEAECARAMAYGMMAVEDGVDALCLGEMGIGNTSSAAALCFGLFGGDAEDWVGTGSGVNVETLKRKTEIVAAGVARHRGACSDPLETLRCLGGHELAAVAGAILAARIARVPVILDGYACTAAAAVLHRMDQTALDHCIVGHLSAEPGHARLLDAIGKRPILDLGMRLGEASGAALALGVLRAALSCHTGMATFEQARVDGPNS